MGITKDFDKPKVGIIGGTGRMGSWFADLLEGLGSEVWRVGRRTPLTPAELARQCDVVVISVPIADTVGVIEEIGPLVPENGLLMDLTSTKKAPMEAMLRYSQAQVVGVHPLFGPDETSHSGLTVALCPGRGESGLNWIEGILRENGFKVTVLDPEEHDRVMGLIQGVNHFSTLALAICVGRSGYGLEALMNASTQTFLHRLDRIRSIMEQPSDLFGSLLMDNHEAERFIEQYLESANELARIISRKDGTAFGQLFDSFKEVFMIPARDPEARR